MPLKHPPYIEFENISKKFGNTLVLDNLNLSIPYGEITAIIGPSGSGKTTMLNLLIGFVKPTKGRILFQSRNIIKDFYYFGNLYKLRKEELKARANELLKLLDIDYARKTLAKRLSAGMGRRLDIACSLIHNPKVLILDEPTQDLDPILRKELVESIRKINKERETTVIITSHLLGEIDDLCDNIGILYKGKIVKIGSPEQLKRFYGKRSMDDIFTFIVQKSERPTLHVTDKDYKEKIKEEEHKIVSVFGHLIHREK
ncbi:ABC transporter ATP-binding protein [Candidatus Woesearchaeota archaeon]|nr:ABC transporter ATP-binding protein [Candidatus Woesearchaeota archaeon]